MSERIYLKIWNYKKGGSMVCDEEYIEFNHNPTLRELTGKLRKYQLQHGLEDGQTKWSLNGSW